ncbi:unnamed protein product [Ilex paraguariensis]|uniref:Uncharacterized protein n=1 Tax=Ilex paraguariensis TaxID=185542 RepID=A0ABC8RUD0_9AQUA
MVEPDIDNKRCGNRWNWAIGALIAISFAIALASRNFPTISMLNRHNRPCQCAEDAHRYKGTVEDCCCDYETVDHLNQEVLRPLLEELVKTPFFRYFKVKLWCDCLFWPEDGMCRLRDCSVCECPEKEFPEPFKKPFRNGLSSDDLICQEGKPEASVDRTIDSKAFRGWIVVDNPWTYDDETDNAEMTYVNLQLNPERYTGYTGPSARRIWDAVYTENCPKYGSEELCQEERILYKLISGLHSSISIHIAADYLLDEATNLHLHVGVSALMDCVGCEKCRLWGKLQVLGLGTALKILFSVNGQDHFGQTLELQRNEVIAMMNLLNRLSESVNYVHEMGPSVERIIGGEISMPSDRRTVQ